MATVRDDAIRLSPDLMAEARHWAEADATPLDQFIAQAVREKVAALKTQRYFAARQARADLSAFDRVLAKSGRDAPRSEDAVPTGWDQDAR